MFFIIKIQQTENRKQLPSPDKTHPHQKKKITWENTIFNYEILKTLPLRSETNMNTCHHSFSLRLFWRPSHEGRKAEKTGKHRRIGQKETKLLLFARWYNCLHRKLQIIYRYITIINNRIQHVCWTVSIYKSQYILTHW